MARRPLATKNPTPLPDIEIDGYILSIFPVFRLSFFNRNYTASSAPWKWLYYCVSPNTHSHYSKPALSALAPTLPFIQAHISSSANWTNPELE